MIAKDENDYINKAIELSKDVEKLISIRKQIFEDAMSSPLFNIKNYSKNFFNLIKNL